VEARPETDPDDLGPIFLPKAMPVTIKCPACKAPNDTGPNCRRCKADLAVLFQIEDQRHTLIRTAEAAIAASDTRKALAKAQSADQLRRDPESVRLLACASLLRGDYAEALRLYSLADDSPSPA